MALAAGLCLLAPAQAAAQSPLPSLEQRRAILGHGRPPVLTVPPRLLGEQDDFDVLDYELSIFLNSNLEWFTGIVGITFTPAPGVARVDELVLDLDDSMSVQSVSLRGLGPLVDILHLYGKLHIRFPREAVWSGETATIDVRWWGQPRQDGGVGMQQSFYGTASFFTPNVYTLSEPYHARTWWPCKDRPDDKATATVSVSHHEELTVVANGKLVDRSAPVDGRVTTTWRESHPIATYLVSFAAARYESCEWTYVSQDGTTSMPVTFWAFADGAMLEDACSDWAVVLDQMDFFARSFGEYPFLDEKYDQVVVHPDVGNRLIGMENQTMSVLGSRWLLIGSELLCAHELAHHWWGDSAGISGFESLWLNEGFATYSEALWWEEDARRTGGQPLATLKEYMRQIDGIAGPFGEYDGTVHAPIDEDGDGWPDGGVGGPVDTVYNKGAWVLHMLRWVLSERGDPGPERLFRVLRRHAAENAGRAVSTEQFVELAGRVAADELGMPEGLDWFFDQWLHREGRPCYRIGWSTAPVSADMHLAWVEVEQGAFERDADTNALTCGGELAEPYRMPVQLKVASSDGSYVTEIVDNRARRSRYEFRLRSPATAIKWDEGGWILKYVQEVDIDYDDDGWPDDVDGCPLVPNPGQEDLDLDRRQDACQEGLDFDGDTIPNHADCAPADPGAWTLLDPELHPELMPLLHVSKEGRSEILLRFDIPTAPGTERPYVVDVVQGRLDRLRSNRSLRDSTCVARDVVEHEVSVPAAQGSRYYVVFPFNGCGPVDESGRLLSACR